MSRRGWQWICAFTLTTAVVWMALRTFPMTWSVEPFETGRLVTWQSWFDPLLPGYALFHAPITALTATVAAALAWFGVATHQVRPTPMWWAAASAVVIILGSILISPPEWPQAVALGLLVAGTFSAWRVVVAEPHTTRSASTP